MGSSFEEFVLSILSKKEKKKKNMKLCLLVFAVVLLSSEVTTAPAPIKDIINAFVPQLTKPGLKNHGTNKVLVGAGIKGLGYLTNNQGLKNLGKQTIGAGAGTLVAAHFFPQGR